MPLSPPRSIPAARASFRREKPGKQVADRSGSEPHHRLLVSQCSALPSREHPGESRKAAGCAPWHCGPHSCHLLLCLGTQSRAGALRTAQGRPGAGDGCVLHSPPQYSLLVWLKACKVVTTRAW